MNVSEKLVRLTQFEVEHAFGFWPDFDLVKKARRMSSSLFRFDVMGANGDIEEIDGAWFRFYNVENGARVMGSKVVDRFVQARRVVHEFNEWIGVFGVAGVRVEIDGALRYLVMTDGVRRVAFID